jgi:hypothetical protein
MYTLAALLPIALGLSAPLIVLAACAFAGGGAGGFFSATWFTVFQQNVPDDVMSRTSAWDWLLSLSTLPLLMILVPPIAERTGNETALLSAGIAAVLATVIATPTRSVASVIVTGVPHARHGEDDHCRGDDPHSGGVERRRASITRG